MMKRMLLCAAIISLAAGSLAHAGNDLSRAAIAGDLVAAKERVKAGEKVTDIDKWGWTALHWAIYYGNMPTAKWLLDQGADPNAKTEKEYGVFLPGTTPLIMAAYYGHDEAIAALLKKKADTGVEDRKGRKAIDYAREYNFDKCVALLSRK